MYQAMSLVLAVCWSLHLIPTAGTGIMILQEETEEKTKGQELEGEQSSVIQLLFSWTIQSLSSVQIQSQSSSRRTNI